LNYRKHCKNNIVEGEPFFFRGFHSILNISSTSISKYLDILSMNSADGSVYPFSTRLIVRMLKPVDGVAAMALGKGAYAIHQSGKWYMNNPASCPLCPDFGNHNYVFEETAIPVVENFIINPLV